MGRTNHVMGSHTDKTNECRHRLLRLMRANHGEDAVDFHVFIYLKQKFFHDLFLNLFL